MNVEHGVTIDGEILTLFETEHEKGVRAVTAVHRPREKRSIGGIRCVKAATREELGHLAIRMTDKCAAANLPAGGQKTLLITGEELPDDEAKAAFIAEHVAAVTTEYDGAIVGPDMGISERVMDLVAASTAKVAAHVTGCSDAKGGLSIDRYGFTAEGLAEATELYSAMTGSGGSRGRVVVQGFGAVGANVARNLADRGFAVVGISTERGTIWTDEGRLPISELSSVRIQTGNDDALFLVAVGQRNRGWVKMSRDPQKLFELEADILVPAARTSCLACGVEIEEVRKENPAVIDAVEYVKLRGIRLIVEGANHPLTMAAERALETIGVHVLPDVLVNCGGLLGCWWEWKRKRPDAIPYDTPLDEAELRQVERQEALELVTQVVRLNVEHLLKTPLKARETVARVISERMSTR